MFTPQEIANSMRLYAVTDRAVLTVPSLASAVAEAIAGGVSCVQLREKKASEAEFEALAKEILPLCRAARIPFIINDDVALALRIDADGVHVGQSDMAAENARALVGSEKIVGISVQTLDQAIAAQHCGADYIGVGAMFGTPTKPDAAEVSFETLRTICDAVRIPVVAIGGFNERTIDQLVDSGVDGVAVVSALFGASDIKAAAITLGACIDKVRQE